MDSSRTKAQATKKARILLKKMKTVGWKMEVHKNIGWHYTIVNGPLTVNSMRFRNKLTYRCIIGTHRLTGVGVLTSFGEGWFSNPNRAARFCMQYAADALERYVDLVESGREALK